MPKKTISVAEKKSLVPVYLLSVPIPRALQSRVRFYLDATGEDSRIVSENVALAVEAVYESELKRLREKAPDLVL